eukprot:8243728-Karenia_brevis.AAC.1
MGSDDGAQYTKVPCEAHKISKTPMCYDTSKSGPGNDARALVNSAEATNKQAIKETKRAPMQFPKEEDTTKGNVPAMNQKRDDQSGEQDAEISDSSPEVESLPEESWSENGGPFIQLPRCATNKLSPRV